MILFVLFATGARSASASELPASKPSVKQELIAVVEAQLAAFRSGDVVKAYSYASRALRAQRPLRTFSAIVEANYPEIWANTDVDFGLARDDGEYAKLNVVVHAGEQRASYDFTLVRERNAWRIEGVLRRTVPKADRL